MNPNNFGDHRCPICNQLFFKGSDSIQVEVILNSLEKETRGNYVYCSKKCFDAKLDTLGYGVPIHERLIITKKEEISNNKYRIYCQELLLKVGD